MHLKWNIEQESLNLIKSEDRFKLLCITKWLHKSSPNMEVGRLHVKVEILWRGINLW